MAACACPPTLSARLPSGGGWTAHRALEALGVRTGSLLLLVQSHSRPDCIHWFSPHIYSPNLPRRVSVPMEPHTALHHWSGSLALHSTLAFLSCCLSSSRNQKTFLLCIAEWAPEPDGLRLLSIVRPLDFGFWLQLLVTI